MGSDTYCYEQRVICSFHQVGIRMEELPYRLSDGNRVDERGCSVV